MQSLSFTNKNNTEVHYLKWDAENPVGGVVISHGMAEHPRRYDNLAKYLTENRYTVYAIYHIGHGEFAEIKGHMGYDEFNLCVSNTNELVELAKKEINVPIFMLGHSMGSFLSQLYIEKYHNIKGVILSGSSNATLLMKMGKPIASLCYAFTKDKTKPSKFMNNLSFGSYNKAFKNPRTDFEWLNRDEKEVDKYIEDPLCGYVCSTSFFKFMCNGLAEMGKKSNMKKIEKDLPVLIHSGSLDPVSNNAKGAYKLEKQYKDLGIKNVKLYVYDGAHHEVYNELNKEEVYKNTVDFLNANIN